MNFPTILYFAQPQTNQSSTPDWSMFGVVATVAAAIITIIVSIIIARAQIKRKSIKCIKVSSAPLVQINSNHVNDLEVYFQKNKIYHATSVVLKVFNSGNLPIDKDDFERPIVFSFSENTKIIKADILSTEPSYLKDDIDISIDNTYIKLDRVLMNPGDDIKVSAIVDSFDENISVRARIKGVKNIQIDDKEYDKRSEFTSHLTSGLITGIIFITSAVVTFITLTVFFK